MSLALAADALRVAMSGPLRLDPSWLADAAAGLAAIEEQLYPRRCPPDCPECEWARDEAALDALVPGRVHGAQARARVRLADQRGRARGAVRNRHHRRERMRWRAERAYGWERLGWRG